MSVNLKISTVGVGQRLVFLHGWGVNSGVWASLIELLKDEFCITTIDLPGYGLNNQHIPEPYNINTIAETVAQCIQPDSIVVGWSLGGLITQKIAILYPEKLTQIILICSSPKFSKELDWPGMETKVLSYFMQQLDVDFNKTLERFLAIQAMGSESARQDTKTIKKAVQQYPLPSKMALVTGLNMLESVDLREQLKVLTVPCHIFLGRLDTLVPETIAPALEKFAPHIKTEVIAKASHAPFISDTQGFAKRLRTILTQ